MTGTFEILKLSIAAEQLTVEYKKENQEIAIYGGIKLSTAPQAGVQIIKDLAVTLGSKDKPGIKIVNGGLESLDNTINGEINLFKITAAPKDLRISYSAAEDQLQITGELTITLALKLQITAVLPGDGLLIDTSTGKVQIRGLSLALDGDIKFGAMTIKGLKVEYSEDDAGEVTIAAAAEIQLPSGLAVGGSFKIINGKLDSIGMSFEKNPEADDQNPNPRVTFKAEVNLCPGDIVLGKINAYVDIKENVDFKADMEIFIPQAVPLTVPLNIVPGHAQPQLALNSAGISFLATSSNVAILPEGTVSIAQGSAITSVSIRFVEGSYVAGEDLLSYTGSTIIGMFDAVDGVLNLSGSGTEDDWSAVLQQVTYSSTGASFTEGNRYL